MGTASASPWHAALLFNFAPVAWMSVAWWPSTHVVWTLHPLSSSPPRASPLCPVALLNRCPIRFIALTRLSSSSLPHWGLTGPFGLVFLCIWPEASCILGLPALQAIGVPSLRRRPFQRGWRAGLGHVWPHQEACAPALPAALQASPLRGLGGHFDPELSGRERFRLPVPMCTGLEDIQITCIICHAAAISHRGTDIPVLSAKRA